MSTYESHVSSLHISFYSQFFHSLFSYRSLSLHEETPDGNTSLAHRDAWSRNLKIEESRPVKNIPVRVVLFGSVTILLLPFIYCSVMSLGLLAPTSLSNLGLIVQESKIQDGRQCLYTENKN